MKLKITNVLFIILNLIIGLFFIASGYFKLHPIEILELQIVDSGIFNWFISPFVARTLISVEFLIGLVFIFNLKYGKKIYISTIVLLIMFSIYLIIDLFIYGNKGNCNCMGDAVKMNPLESIGKNIVLILLIFILYKFHKRTYFLEKLKKIILVILIMASISTPYFLNPIDLVASNNNSNDDVVGYKMDFDLIYKSKKQKSQKLI